MSDQKKLPYISDFATPIDDVAFNKFIADNGNEKAAIYLQAMADFNSQLEEILGGNFRGCGVFNSSHSVRKQLIDLVHHNNKFLKKFTSTDEIEISKLISNHLTSQ